MQWWKTIYLIWRTRRVSGTTLIKYAQQLRLKGHSFKSMGAKKKRFEQYSKNRLIVTYAWGWFDNNNIIRRVSLMNGHWCQDWYKTIDLLWKTYRRNIHIFQMIVSSPFTISIHCSVRLILTFTVGISLTNLSSHIFMHVQRQDLDFQRRITWYFFIFSELRWEVIVRSADIGGIVDHHCLCFLFTILCRLRATMEWYLD